MSEVFVDSPPPEVLGLPAEPLNRLVGAANGLGYLAGVRVLPPGVDYRTRGAGIALVPLVERIQEGELTGPEDVSPYVDDVIEAVPILRRYASLPFARDIMASRIEDELPDRVRDVMQSDKVQDGVDKAFELADPYIEILAGFENPREQLVQESKIVIDGIQTYARKQCLARASADFAKTAPHTRRAQRRWRQMKKHGLDGLVRP